MNQDHFWELEVTELRRLAEAADRFGAASAAARNTGDLSVEASDATVRLQAALAANAGEAFPVGWFQPQVVAVIENLRAVEESVSSRQIVAELESASAAYVIRRNGIA